MVIDAREFDHVTRESMHCELMDSSSRLAKIRRLFQVRALAFPNCLGGPNAAPCPC